MPSPQFTPAEVLEIRHQHSQDKLDVRVWADTKRCSIETVRRVARGDTYRHQAGVKAHPSFGGLPSQAPAMHPTRLAKAAAGFIPPTLAPQADLALPDNEPDDGEAGASLARLQAALAMPVPGNAQASQAVDLIEEMKGKARLSRDQDQARADKPGAELG